MAFYQKHPNWAQISRFLVACRFGWQLVWWSIRPSIHWSIGPLVRWSFGLLVRPLLITRHKRLVAIGLEKKLGFAYGHKWRFFDWFGAQRPTNCFCILRHAQNGFQKYVNSRIFLFLHRVFLCINCRFLVVSHDSKRVCPSVCWSVGPSVRWSVGNAFVGGQRQASKQLILCKRTC